MSRPTEQKRKFVAILVQQGLKDAAGAAIKAGYAPKSAKVTASRMLKQDDFVRSEIERLTNKAVAKDEKGAVDVIKELMVMGFANPLDLVQIDRETGHIELDPRQIPHHLGAAIKELKITTTTVPGRKKNDKPTVTQHVDLKMHDKHGPLSTLARCLGLIEGDSPIVNNFIQNNIVMRGALGRMPTTEVAKMLTQYSAGGGLSSLVEET